jgi:hypothetical protein
VTVSLEPSCLFLRAGQQTELGLEQTGSIHLGEESEVLHEVPVFGMPNTRTSIGTTRVALDRSMFVKFGLPPFFLGGAGSLSSAIED